MKNRHGQDVITDTINTVEFTDDGDCEITLNDNGSVIFIQKGELDGFVPLAGDMIILMTTNYSWVRGIIIENRVIRYSTAEEAEEQSKAFRDANRLRHLEEYVKNGAALKARAEALPLPLRKRIARFVAESGEEFWIEDAPYEMYALEGAAALLRKVQNLGLISNVHVPDGDAEAAVKWVKDWWALNSAEHGYDYKTQMEMVPDFGDGHSGNTAGAATMLALTILSGEDV